MSTQASRSVAQIPLGVCVTPENAADLARGYDHIELSVSDTLCPLEDDVTYALREPALKALRPPIYSFNLFAPASVVFVGDQVDAELVEIYVERAFRRAGALGGKEIGFGCGRSRWVPEGFSRAKAWDQLVALCQLCGKYGERYGITFAIEPINSRDSNILNTYPEAARLARDVAHPYVKVVADIYHFIVDAEPLEDILNAPEMLCHVHLADSGRRNPGTGSYPLRELFALLRDIDYRGRASIECTWGDNLRSESAHSLAFLRPLAGWA